MLNIKETDFLVVVSLILFHSPFVTAGTATVDILMYDGPF